MKTTMDGPDCQLPPTRRREDGENDEGAISGLAGMQSFRVGNHRCVVVPFTRLATDGGDLFHVEDYVDSGKVAGTLIIGEHPYVVVSIRCRGDQSSATQDDQTSRENIAEVLTRRELEVATLVAGGKVNKQIAHQLHISEWTVSTHLRRIFCKLGVKSRAAVAAHVASSLTTQRR